MKKLNGLLICMMILGVLLTGCSSGGTNKTNSESAENEKGQSNKEITLKVGVAVNPQHSLYEGVSKFKEIIEQESNQRIKVNLFHSGQMGGDRELAEAIQLGTIEAAIVSPAALGNFVPTFSLFDLPFLFSNEEQVDKFLNSTVGDEILNSGTSKGFVGLGFMELGFRNLTNSKHEVKSVKDVNGLKIRVAENPMLIDTWNALGAKPTPMAFTELFTALQQGTVDAQENPFGQIASSKFFEVQQYLSIINQSYNPAPLMIGKKFLDSLSKEDQELILKAGKEAAGYQVKLNRERENTSLQLLKDEGMVITEVAPEEINEFRKAVQPVTEKYTEKIGKDLMEKVLSTIE